MKFGDGFRFGMGFWLAGILWAIIPWVLVTTMVGGLIGLLTNP